MDRRTVLKGLGAGALMAVVPVRLPDDRLMSGTVIFNGKPLVWDTIETVTHSNPTICDLYQIAFKRAQKAMVVNLEKNLFMVGIYRD